jgi:agmatine/peptidylarginine deiminase
MKTKILLLSIIFLLAGNLLISQTIPDYRKLHYLSEEEMLTPFDPQRDFYPTDPPEGEIRNVAEFNKMQGVLVRYPFGIPIDLIKEMAEDISVTTIVANTFNQQTVTTIYQNNNVNLDNCNFLIAPTDSYWVRDYGPWFVFDGNNQPGIVNFPYNRPRPNDNNIPIKVSEFLEIDLYGMNLISTGGNYMCSSMGIAASTDLVWEENPTLTHIEVADYVNDYLGNPIYNVTPDPLGEPSYDPIKHIDCWGKYLSPGKILIGQVPETDSRYQDFEDVANFFATQTSSYGIPYEVYRIYTPGNYPDTPYTNSLILNNKVFVPLTGSQWDEEAIESYEEAMPGYEIIGIIDNSWLNSDALHCRTKGLADLGMLYIDHLPTTGTVTYQETYEINANITACSGDAIYADSVFVFYKINNGSYTSGLMQFISGNTYTGLIENVLPNDVISYYIYAADESGRNATNPFIGEPDPFVFTNFYIPTTEISFNPDTVLFLTIEEMVVGIPLDIINLTSNNITINSITDYGTEFMWYVEEMPDLPYTIPGNRTLSLNIVCDLPVEKYGEFIVDSMLVETNLDSYREIIMIDSDLISNIEDVSLTDDFVNVFPNPFKNQLNFVVRNSESSKASIQIFDIDGRIIIDRIETINFNSENIIHIINNLKPGTYFYKVTSDNKSKSGKLIRVE